MTAPPSPTPIQISKPTASFSVDSEYAHVLFQRYSARSGEWKRESYSPRQADLAARAPSNVIALVPGYWGDAELTADVLAYMAAEYGVTDVVIVDAAPAQPDVPVGKITLAPDATPSDATPSEPAA